MRLEPSDPGTPESAYDEAWAETLLERVLTRLKEEFSAQGNDGRFEILKQFLTDDRGPFMGAPPTSMMLTTR